MEFENLAKKTAVRKHVGEWQISFTPNVHMYCHDLRVEKGAVHLQIPCEDLPERKKTKGIWLHELKISAEVKEELKSILLDWAGQMSFYCLVYTERDTYVASQGPRGS